MNNSETKKKEIDVRPITLGELISKEYHFVIPDYQRGYRWKKQQIIDLLKDLATFENQNKKNDNFYCLQPLAVQKISDQHPYHAELSDSQKDNSWIVIDGQQRLTTLYIILQYWYKTHKKDEDNKTFTLEYKTRKSSSDFLLNISNEQSRNTNDNIDYYYMSEAYSHISKFVETDNGVYFKGNTNGKKYTPLFDLLRSEGKNDDDENERCIKFLWYELPDDANAVQKFVSLNKGIIPLTDAELIKAIFLKKPSANNNEEKERWQIMCASEWEMLENKLNDDGFWSFLVPEGTVKPNRIDILFELLYLSEKNEETEEILQKAEKEHRVFNHFYGKLSENDIEKKKIEWKKVMTAFETLEGWYENPLVHNLIGFIRFFGIKTLSDIYISYQECRNRDQFHEKLLSIIKEEFKRIKVRTENEDVDLYTINSNSYYLDINYKDKRIVRETLLLTNILQLNKQGQNSLGSQTEMNLSKFPFAALHNSNWDIEHIDSQNCNNLKKNGDQIDWIHLAIDEAPSLSSETYDSFSDLAEVEEFKKRYEVYVDKKNNGGTDKDAINAMMNKVESYEKKTRSEFQDFLIQTMNKITQSKQVNESTSNEDCGIWKDNIGNLTLLDAKTNRGYGNSIFYVKKRMILGRQLQGQFVPVRTLNVFQKQFQDVVTDPNRWNVIDIKHNNREMLKMLIDENIIEL